MKTAFHQFKTNSNKAWIFFPTLKDLKSILSSGQRYSRSRDIYLGQESPTLLEEGKTLTIVAWSATRAVVTKYVFTLQNMSLHYTTLFLKTV